MRTMWMWPVAVLLAVVIAAPAFAAETPRKDVAVTVVYKDGSKVALTGFEVGMQEGGLFGSSLKALDALPVKTDNATLNVPLANLAKIAFVSVDKKTKAINVVLTAATPKPGEPKTLEAWLDPKTKLVWKAVHPFAKSEITLDPAKIKELVFEPPKP